MKNLSEKLNRLPKPVQLLIALVIFAVMFAIFYYLGFGLVAPSK